MVRAIAVAARPLAAYVAPPTDTDVTYTPHVIVFPATANVAKKSTRLQSDWAQSRARTRDWRCMQSENVLLIIHDRDIRIRVQFSIHESTDGQCHITGT